MAIEFKKTKYGYFEYTTGCVVVRIDEDGATVTIDGFLDTEEQEQILSKMKELQSEVKRKSTTDMNSYDPSSPNGYD